MRWDDIYVGGCAFALGAERLASDAVAGGMYEARDHETDGYVSARVASDEAMIEMAVKAAALAIERSGVGAGDVALVIHTCARHDAPSYMAPASYIQSRTVAGPGLAFELNQHSNGGLVSLQLAAAYLAGLGKPAAALLTAGEPRASRDHFRTEKGIVFGDGATALVLSNDSGVARVASAVTHSDSSFSDLPLRADDTGDDGSSPDERQVAFLVEYGERLVRMVQSLTARQRACIEEALVEAGAVSSDITRWVFAHTGLSMIDWELRRAFDIVTDDTTWEWGRTVGHLGAGDQFGGLAYLLESGAVRKGDRVALCGVGYGFTVSCAVLEILAEAEGHVAV